MKWHGGHILVPGQLGLKEKNRRDLGTHHVFLHQQPSASQICPYVDQVDREVVRVLGFISEDVKQRQSHLVALGSSVGEVHKRGVLEEDQWIDLVGTFNVRREQPVQRGYLVGGWRVHHFLGQEPLAQSRCDGVRCSQRHQKIVASSNSRRVGDRRRESKHGDGENTWWQLPELRYRYLFIVTADETDAAKRVMVGGCNRLPLDVVPFAVTNAIP